MTDQFDDNSAEIERTTTAQTIESAAIWLAANPDAPHPLTKALRKQFGLKFNDAVRAMVRVRAILELGQG